MKKVDFLHYVFSYALSTNCYRNLDVVENSHAGDSIVCDDVFYRNTFEACSKSISEWVPRLINEFSFIVENKAAKDSAAANVLGDSFLSYKTWDCPNEVTDEFVGDITGFLLKGTFRKACQEGWLLNDDSMNKINHDVNNRMYTLIKRGFINIDLDILKNW